MWSKCFGSTAKALAVVTALGFATQAMAAVPEFQGFETDTSGWLGTAQGWNGWVYRVPSGTAGITSASGSYHGHLYPGDPGSFGYGFDDGPAYRGSGVQSTWPGATWAQVTKLYLDNNIIEGAYQEEVWTNPSLGDLTGAYIGESTFRPEKYGASTWSVNLPSASFGLGGTSGTLFITPVAGNQWVEFIQTIRASYDGFIRVENYVLAASNDAILGEITSGPTTRSNSATGGQRSVAWYTNMPPTNNLKTIGFHVDDTASRFLVPGDTDVDWDVDLADLSILGANWANVTTLERGYRQGDYDETGFVNLADLSLLGANWGTIASGSAADAVGGGVPEPATLLLLGTGGLLLMGRRRRS
jgi:hypothetical protein